MYTSKKNSLKVAALYLCTRTTAHSYLLASVYLLGFSFTWFTFRFVPFIARRIRAWRTHFVLQRSSLSCSFSFSLAVVCHACLSKFFILHLMSFFHAAIHLGFPKDCWKSKRPSKYIKVNGLYFWELRHCLLYEHLS